MIKRSLILIGLIVSAWIVAVASKDSGRDLYVSLVEKDSVKIFYNRLATENFQVVVTDHPVASALESFKISDSGEKPIYLMELMPLSHLLFDKNLKCLSNICAGPSQNIDKHGDQNHFHATGDVRYQEPIGRKLLLSKEARNFIPSQRKEEFFADVTVDTQFMRNMLEQFTGVTTVKMGGKEIRLGERRSVNGRKLAREFLKQEYEKLGFKVTSHEFELQRSSGTNFVAEKAGKEKAFLIISAHYDTMSTVGADDDASGIISGLATAKALADMDLKYSLRFVGFDEEELGLVGSKAYAAYLKRTEEIDDLIGVLQLEMTGYDADKDGAIHVIDCNENTSAKLTNYIETAITDKGLPLEKVNACTNRSDHAAFWRYNKPAIVMSQNFFGGDSNPCYHKACDSVEKINYTYMGNISQALAEAALQILR